MMQPVIAERVCAGRHGLDALAIAGANQAGDVGRAHPTPRFVTQFLQIRLKPMIEIPLPILFHRQPPSKLASYESRIAPAGNPKNHTSPKVVIGRLIAPIWKVCMARTAHPSVSANNI
jgi:hypothetical protein